MRGIVIVAGALLLVAVGCGRSEVGPWPEHDPDALESCAEILLDEPGAPSDVYWIDPDLDRGPPFEVHCDMTTAGGGWTLVAKIAASDGVDRWGWDAAAYRRGAPFGDATTLAPTDAKSAAYAEVPGTELLIVDLSRPAHVAHAYASSPRPWEAYLGSIWDSCGHAISRLPLELVDDGVDSLIGPALYFRHYDGDFPDCGAEERAMLSELPFNAGWVEVGVGITEGNAAHLDAQSSPAGAALGLGNVPQTVEDYALYVR